MGGGGLVGHEIAREVMKLTRTGRGQDGGELQRKLAQLELDVDRQQGWIRGGSKTDVIPTPLTSQLNTCLITTRRDIAMWHAQKIAYASFPASLTLHACFQPRADV